MKKNKQTNVIASILMIIFMLLFLVISGRFIYIQATGVVNDVSLTDWANDKRETSIPLRAERGNIYDQNGMILAYNRPAYRLYAILDSAHSKNQKEPKHVVDADETANKLAPILDMDVQEIKTIIENGMDEGRFQVEFGQAGNNLTQQEMEEIKALQIPGIYFAEDRKSTRLNSSHVAISYAVFCLKK